MLLRSGGKDVFELVGLFVVVEDDETIRMSVMLSKWKVWSCDDDNEMTVTDGFSSFSVIWEVLDCSNR